MRWVHIKQTGSTYRGQTNQRQKWTTIPGVCYNDRYYSNAAGLTRIAVVGRIHQTHKNIINRPTKHQYVGVHTYRYHITMRLHFEISCITNSWYLMAQTEIWSMDVGGGTLTRSRVNKGLFAKEGVSRSFQ